MEYYVCEYGSGRALLGPYERSQQVVDFIYAQPNQLLYCNMSRYELTKHDIYPSGKDGDKKIERDIRRARGLMKERAWIVEQMPGFVKWCVAMEASGNHGAYGGGPGGNADMRAGVVFWGTGRGWQLRKGWREVFQKRFPYVELPSMPEPQSRAKSVSRKVLEKLTTEYKSFRSGIDGLEYWGRGDVQQGVHPGWRLSFWEEEDDRWERWIYLGQDSEAARDTLQRLISEWKASHEINGSEPQLGGQLERTGNEPIINRER